MWRQGFRAFLTNLDKIYVRQETNSAILKSTLEIEFLTSHILLVPTHSRLRKFITTVKIDWKIDFPLLY